MSRNLWLSSISALALLGLSHVVGCGTTDDEPSTSARLAALAACGLNDGTVDVNHDDLRACDPQNTKKTTICHIPPGNPANAHTLCIGNPAVPAHLHNHGDYLGPCVAETECPPPPGGVGGATGSGGATGTGGATGEPDTVIVP